MTVAAIGAFLKGLPWSKIAPVAVVVALVAALGISRCQLSRQKARTATATTAAAIATGNVATLSTARKADDTAALQRTADQAHRAAEDAALKESTDALPDAPLTARQRARLECLRATRLARTAGHSVPACGPAAAPARAG